MIQIWAFPADPICCEQLNPAERVNDLTHPINLRLFNWRVPALVKRCHDSGLVKTREVKIVNIVSVVFDGLQLSERGGSWSRPSTRALPKGFPWSSPWSSPLSSRFFVTLIMIKMIIFSAEVPANLEQHSCGEQQHNSLPCTH